MVNSYIFCIQKKKLSQCFCEVTHCKYLCAGFDFRHTANVFVVFVERGEYVNVEWSLVSKKIWAQSTSQICLLETSIVATTRDNVYLSKWRIACEYVYNKTYGQKYMFLLKYTLWYILTWSWFFVLTFFFIWSVFWPLDIYIFCQEIH